MYSVLIQNQKTMDSFHQFRPIFMNALNQGDIGACLWGEAGTTIDTAVPELCDLVQDKEEWRAIIVRIEDGVCMQSVPTAPENPYDFLIDEHESEDAAVRESTVPLVRLTHMLAGIPAPSIQFETEIKQEEGKEPRVVYVPFVSEQDKQTYEELCKKYHFNGPRPSEILLISLRKKSEVNDEFLLKSWRNNNETDRSKFWQRNNYPSICRFICVDMEDKGEVQRTADLFTVWTCVMLLATNSIDPSTLQAYTLHQVSATFDKEALAEVMQGTVSRSLGARHFIQKALQRELELEAKEDIIVPDYRMQVPIVMKLPPRKDVSINPNAFRLTSKTTTSDAELWREMRDRAEKQMNNVTISANRALEQGADLMRNNWAFRDDEVYPLSKHQAEDMAAELDHLQKTIFEARTELPEAISPDEATLEKLIHAVKSFILERLTRHQALLCYALAAIAILLSFVPGFIRRPANSAPINWPPLLGAAIFALVAFGVAEVVPLLIQQMRLRGTLQRFNRFSSNIITRTAENATVYSRYMGDVASFMRGNSFLTWVRRKNYFRDEAQFYKRNHIVALSAFLQQLREWCTAFHLTISLEMAEVDDDFVMDTDLAPQINPLYSLEDQGNYSVPVNATGDTVESPFRFIQRLNIRREELYDDAD